MLYFFQETANLVYLQIIKSKIKNVCFTKFRKSYKITLQLTKNASQFAKYNLYPAMLVHLVFCLIFSSCWRRNST